MSGRLCPFNDLTADLLGTTLKTCCEPSSQQALRSFWREYPSRLRSKGCHVPLTVKAHAHCAHADRRAALRDSSLLLPDASLRWYVKYVYFRLGSLSFFHSLVSFLWPFALSGSLRSERLTFERFCVLVCQRALRGRRGQPAADAMGLTVSSRVCSLILCGLLLKFSC